MRARADQEQHSDQPKTERYYVEHVKASTDKNASNDLVRETMVEKQRRGWKLASMNIDQSGDSVELVWDKFGSNERASITWH